MESEEDKQQGSKPRPALTSRLQKNNRLTRVTESRVREELERKDPSGSGMVAEQALGKILEQFGADLAGADLGRLMHRFDAHEVSIGVSMYRGHVGDNVRMVTAAYVGQRDCQSSRHWKPEKELLCVSEELWSEVKATGSFFR